MATLEKSITIKAPVDKVYRFLDEPANLPEIWPSMVEVTDVRRLLNGGTSYKWVYKMAPVCVLMVPLKILNTLLKYVANKHVVEKNKGGIEGTTRWGFQPEACGTKVTFGGEYKVPIPLLGRLAEAFTVRQNEHEAELVLANLKARMET